MDIAIISIIGIATIGGVIVIWPTTKLALDMAPYLTANTRCSARMGMLLSAKKYADLLSATSQDELLAILEDSAYQNAVEQGKSSLKLSQSLEKDWFATLTWLERIVPNNMEATIQAIRDIYETLDIKNAINSTLRGQPLPSPQYLRDQSFRLKLEGASDLQSLLSLLEESPYGTIFKGKNVQQDLGMLMTKLDVFTIDRVWSIIEDIKDDKVKQALEDYWKTRMDLTNLRMILRKIYHASTELPLLNEGRISTDDWNSITDLGGLENIFSNSPYGTYLTKQDTEQFELAIYKYLAKQADDISTRYSLKGGQIISYLIKKELELRNLRLLLKLKAENWESDLVQPLLTITGGST